MTENIKIISQDKMVFRGQCPICMAEFDPLEELYNFDDGKTYHLSCLIEHLERLTRHLIDIVESTKKIQEESRK
jgi:hypothetical protein